MAATVLSGSTLAAAPASGDDAIAVPDLPPLPVLPQLGLSPLPSLAGVPADGLWPTEVDTGNLTDGPFDDIVVANEAGTSVTVLRANPRAATTRRSGSTSVCCPATSTSTT
ncbi:hypothetical protein ACFSVJ_04810 [Prauserella oleivorans]